MTQVENSNIEERDEITPAYSVQKTETACHLMRGDELVLEHLQPYYMELLARYMNTRPAYVVISPPFLNVQTTNMLNEFYSLGYTLFAVAATSTDFPTFILVRAHGIRF